MLKATLDVISALEGLSGELACQHVSSEEIDTIRRLNEHMIAYYEAGDLTAYFEVNQRIHETLVAAARNEVLLETYNNLNERVRRFRFSQAMSATLWDQVVDEHEQIIAALESRDSDWLGRILRGHLKHKLDRVAVDDDPDADELAS